MKVYRIIRWSHLENGVQYQVNDKYVHEHIELHNVDGVKKDVEDLFELVRKNKFPELPNRYGDNYFVFPTLEDEIYWLCFLSGNHDMNYQLLELEIDANMLTWFDVDLFNKSLNLNKDEIIKNAERYWESNTHSINHNIQQEGLTNVIALITNVWTKHWSCVDRNTIMCEKSSEIRGDLGINDLDIED